MDKMSVSKTKKSEYSLEMDHVFVGYGEGTVLYDITLKVKKGSILGVIGGSGAGKSTAIRAMTAQLKPSKGTCRTAGFNVKSHPSEVQMRIGYVPQLEYLSLYYKFNALDNAKFFGRHFGISDKEIEKRTKDVMSILGLGDEEFITKPVKKLSGGEKKRVSIMIGLINQPEILFLDEPTTGLDPHLRIEVLNFLSKINKEYGTTMVLVSHDLECVDYCDTVMVFSDGCVVDFGDPRKMTRSLPNNGGALTIKFKSMEPDDDEKIKELEEIKYLLHVGRNTFRLFIPSEEKVSNILNKLEDFHLYPINHYVNNCTFLDYFRVHSLYTYPEKAQNIKEKLEKE